MCSGRCMTHKMQTGGDMLPEPGGGGGGNVAWQMVSLAPWGHWHG